MIQKVKDHHFFMWDYLVSLISSLMRPAMIFLLFLTFTLMLLFAGSFYYLEADVNPGIPDFFNSFYFTVTTMASVGYGDIVPITYAGKALSIFMILVGTGLFASYTAIIALTVIEIEQQKGPDKQK